MRINNMILQIVKMFIHFTNSNTGKPGFVLISRKNIYKTYKRLPSSPYTRYLMSFSLKYKSSTYFKPFFPD